MGSFEVPWAFTLDPLSSMMILVVTGIGFLIHVYSTAYMDHEPRPAYARSSAISPLLLLHADARTWEHVPGHVRGLGGCWAVFLPADWVLVSQEECVRCGKKAFIVNRVGDWGFVLGIFLIFFTFGTVDFHRGGRGCLPDAVEAGAFGVVSLICLFLFIGAIGKSAQIPLYIWLPDAMEGPTPVSALIHAATMVTAGVYMVCRNAVLFTHAPMVMTIVAVVGAATALVAATIGLVQTDIKKVLAYSTVSQLGYMFLATGSGAFGAAAFHLMTHAFFKALLFLGSGSVIHAMNDEQEMTKMGGLRAYMPTTFLTMFIGALAIAGVPGLAGFFSKDEILAYTFLESPALWVIGAITAAMTAFYMFRLIYMTFYGEYRGPAWEQGHDETHGHDDAPGHHAWHRTHAVWRGRGSARRADAGGGVTDLYRRGEEGDLRAGSRAVVPWQAGVVFRCPCDGRHVYVKSPPHAITFDGDGVLTLEPSCGSKAGRSGRPQNWCHFHVRAGRPKMCSDAKCPGGVTCSA